MSDGFDVDVDIDVVVEKAGFGEKALVIIKCLEENGAMSSRDVRNCASRRLAISIEMTRKILNELRRRGLVERDSRRWFLNGKVPHVELLVEKPRYEE